MWQVRRLVANVVVVEKHSIFGDAYLNVVLKGMGRDIRHVPGWVDYFEILHLIFVDEVVELLRLYHVLLPEGTAGFMERNLFK